MATARRPSFECSWPRADVSAAMPVSVMVSTVVGRSGTDSLRAVEFWMPIAGASSTMSRMICRSMWRAVGKFRLGCVERAMASASSPPIAGSGEKRFSR